MARPQELPYTRKDVIRAFEMFAKDGEPEGYINPEKLEEALVRAQQDNFAVNHTTQQAPRTVCQHEVAEPSIFS